MEYIILLLGFICSIISYHLTRTGELIMWDNIVSIATAVTAIIAPIIAIITMSRKTNNKIDKLQKRIGYFQKDIGFFDNNTLCGYLLDSQKNIIFDIGRNDRPSLTKQHESIQNLLQKEIDTAERRYSEEEKRIRDFTVEQHNMNDTIKDFRLFIDSWQRMAFEINEDKQRINKLEIENSQLKVENRELHIKLNKGKHRNVPEL